MVHLAICLPSCGTHESETVLALMSTVVQHQANNITQTFLLQSQSGIATSRNALVHRALDGKADFLAWWDSDIVTPHPSHILKLMQHDKDICGASYPKRVAPHTLTGVPVHPEKAHHGLHEFEYLPAGFSVVKADVYRRIPQPWYFESYGYLGPAKTQLADMFQDSIYMGCTPEAAERMAEFALTIPEIAESRRLSVDVSEDVNFCLKAKRHGYQIWGDLDVTRDLIHIGKNLINLGSTEITTTYA